MTLSAALVETKKNNVVINNLVEKLNDNETSICVNTEREVSRYFQANCNTPLAALAKISGNTIQLNAMIGSLDAAAAVKPQSRLRVVARQWRVQTHILASNSR